MAGDGVEDGTTSNQAGVKVAEEWRAATASISKFEDNFEVYLSDSWILEAAEASGCCVLPGQ